MVRKKVEGNEEQRRAAAHDAGRSGAAPSAGGTTTGASKQRTHLRGRDTLTHEERLDTLHRGKQQWRAGDLTGAPSGAPGAGEPVAGYSGRGRPGYTDDHERAYQALVEAQAKHGGEAVYLEVIARTAGMPRERMRALLHDLVTVHGLATELLGTDDPDLGPRFETRPAY